MKNIFTDNKILIIAGLLVLGLSGCASTTMDTNLKLAVDTDVSGQSIHSRCVLKNDKSEWVVHTPGFADVARSADDLSITCLSDNGAFAGKKTVESSANSGMYGNLLVGGLVGMIVDHHTGKGFSYPNKVTVDLTFSQASQAPEAPGLILQ